MTGSHLAQVNIGLPIEPVESERLRGFMAMLEPINALADTAAGFVWRLQTEDGDATAIRAFEDERLIINVSVWESVETFAAFVYGPEHSAVMRQRRSWFVPMQV
jgi:heme-degrading monooxygenase HmoA